MFYKPKRLLKRRQYQPKHLLKKPPVVINWRRIWHISVAIWAFALLAVIVWKTDSAPARAATVKEIPPELADALHANKMSHLEPALDLDAIKLRAKTNVEEEPITILASETFAAAPPEQGVPEESEPDPEPESEESEPVKVNPETGMTYDDYYALFTPRLKTMFCQTGWGEADVIKSLCEIAMCYCVIFNRFDTGAFGDTFEAIITSPGQFVGYRSSNPVTERHEQLLEIIIDQWIRMQLGESPDEVGWPIPTDILYWHANSDYTHNLFYKFENFNSGRKIYFDYSQPLHNPYDS